MNVKKRTSFITGLAIFLAAIFMVAGVAIAETTISIEPANAQIEVNGQVRVNIYANNADQLISMGVKVTFDPAVLEVISAEKYTAFADGWMMDADGNVATDADRYVTPPIQIDPSGSVTMVGGRFIGPTGASTTGLSGKVLLGWIDFKAKATGSTNLNVDFGMTNPNEGKTFNNFVKLGGTVDEPTNVPGDLGTITAICVGDLNGDGIVDVLDLGILRSHFGQSGTNVTGDLNGDGIVDVLDLGILRSHFGSSCPQ